MFIIFDKNFFTEEIEPNYSLLRVFNYAYRRQHITSGSYTQDTLKPSIIQQNTEETMHPLMGKINRVESICFSSNASHPFPL